MRKYSVLLYWILFVIISHSSIGKRIYNLLNFIFRFDIDELSHHKATDPVVFLMANFHKLINLYKPYDPFYRKRKVANPSFPFVTNVPAIEI